jgi:16S rRNA (cytosine967-C5)-methyltransferase
LARRSRPAEPGRARPAPGTAPPAAERARRSGAGPPRGASARSVALDVLVRVEVSAAFADRLLDARPARAGLDARDRGLATELVLGTLRWQRWLDWQLGRVSHRPLAALAPWARALLRLTAYQLAFLDRIPAWAAINEAVELAKRRRPPGAAGYVNAVLRALAAGPRPWPEPDAPDPVEALALRTSQPTWLVRRWWARYGPAEAEALARAMNGTPPVVVRANTLRASPEAVRAALAAAGVTAGPARLAPEGLVLEAAGDLRGLGPLEAGLATVQDEGAILVGHALGPAPGDTVADVCAAPGAKTTHLAALMGNRGRVIAADPHPGRLALLRAACARLGATIVEPRLGDAAALAALVGPVCDGVLVDAPCSNLGVLRRNPDGKWRRRPEDLAALAETQVAILDAAGGLVRTGGVLVYATCSLEPEENEAVVAAVRARRPDLVPDPLPPAVPAPCREGPALLRTAPHRHGCDGFTAHRLRRRA